MGTAPPSPWICAAGLIAVVYSAGFASSDEQEDLSSRFGAAWTEYAGAVRSWWPRWHPWRHSTARLYVATTCPMCSQIGDWIAQRKPEGLEIIAAEEHPSRALTRMTYNPCDDSPSDQGVAAFARALEHLHFGWAFAGWAMRLPGLRQGIQIVVDACGGAPRVAGAGSKSPLQTD